MLINNAMETDVSFITEKDSVVYTGLLDVVAFHGKEESKKVWLEQSFAEVN